MQGRVLVWDHVRGGNGRPGNDKCHCGGSPCTWQSCRGRGCRGIVVLSDIVLEIELMKSQCRYLGSEEASTNGGAMGVFAWLGGERKSTR